MKHLLLISLFLSGCAALPGVVTTKDEREACEKSGCTVWTIEELTRLAKKFFNEGYRSGKASI